MEEKRDSRRCEEDYSWISSYGSLNQNEKTSFVKACFTQKYFLKSEKQNIILVSLDLRQNQHDR